MNNENMVDMIEEETLETPNSYGRGSSLIRPYVGCNILPTRDGSSHITATWNKAGTTIQSMGRIMLYITSTPFDDIVVNSSYNTNQYGIANPWSDSMSDVTMYDMTNYDGELCQYWTSKMGYTVCIGYQYVNQEGTKKYGIGYMGESYSNYITSSAPSISYSNNTITIGALASGRRILEFHRTDKSYGMSTGITDEETLNEMFYTSLLNMERDNPYQSYYYLANNPSLAKWAPGSYTVGVNFKDTTNQSRISTAIDRALTQVNSIMNEFNINFTRSGTTGDISIIVDTEYNLYGITPAEGVYLYGGTWEISNYSGNYISGATVRLANDWMDSVPFTTYETVAFEEILQSMGAGYDQMEYPYNTIHVEDNYYNKASTMYTKDANILRLLYSSLVNSGDRYYDVCRKLNIPKGAYCISSSTTDSVRTVTATDFLDRGGTYQVRAFIVNSSGNVTGTSDWITITVPDVTVDKWSWTSTNGPQYYATAAQTTQFYNVLRGTALPENGFSYKVWNDLVEKVNEVRTAKGYTWRSDNGYGKNGCKVSAGDYVSASKYNEVRVNLGSIISTNKSGYPSTVVSQNGQIYGWLIYRLGEVINEIIDTL